MSEESEKNENLSEGGGDDVGGFEINRRENSESLVPQNQLLPEINITQENVDPILKDEEDEAPENNESDDNSSTGLDKDDEFFERFSSIRLQYEDSERKTIKEFQFQSDVVDGTALEQIFPTIGGWNVDDLYSEILFAIIHTLKNENSETDPLISHLQQVFHIDNDKHSKLLLAAREKKSPPMVLNMEVVEAKGLHGKDVNGLSDPFCTIYISPKQKHNTSMKPETLTPVWREYFSLPVTNTQDETLTIEVWDYDPDESVSDKMRRFGEVKSTKGLRVLMKEIALTASTGKQQHDFLGHLKIPLKDIPGDGFDSWFPLEGKNGGKKSRGELLVRMAVGTEKEKRVAAQEYRHALHLLLVHELSEESVELFTWSGTFANKNSEYILRQLQWRGALTPSDLNMAKWLVYSRVQCDHALNAKLFPPLFNNLAEYLESYASDDEVRKFWTLTDKLLETFANFIKNVHQCFLNNSEISAQVYHMLKTVSLIMEHMKNRKRVVTDLDSKLTPELIREKFENSIKSGAVDLFTSVTQIDEGSDETPVENMIKVGQLLIADLRRSFEVISPCFKELIGIDYFELTYKIYDEKYCEVVEPVVKKMCSNLKRIDMKNESTEEQDLSNGTTLFELYLAVRQFSDLASNLKPGSILKISGVFHNWFYASVAQWLDIAFYKAMSRIKKAVQLDNLKPVDKYVQRSSSAVDTANIFHQIQIFWNQLAWPDVEGSYTFVAKILDDLCRCIISYGEIMCKKVEELERKNHQNSKYEISDELCSAVNNIEYVGLEMKPISEKLGSVKIIQELSTVKGQNIGSQCQRTLDTVIENAIENINNKIYEILEGVGAKMERVIYRLLVEGGENTNEEEGVEKIIKYLDSNLVKIKNKTTPANFDRLFTIIWENAAIALRDLVKSNVDKRRPPSFFQGVSTMLQILIDFFYPDSQSAALILESNSKIREIIEIIKLHGASSPNLIQQYFQMRYNEQAALNVKGAIFGMLTLRASYCETSNAVRVEILNARNLKAGDANGLCDPFVKLHVVPDELYPNCARFKTKVKKKTLFPLFDETFSIPISRKEMSEGGLLRFGVKDHDFIGRNEFLGEVFLPLSSLPFTTMDTSLRDLPQQHLVITRPGDLNLSPFVTLESRNWDKIATEFVKKERAKFVNGTQ